MNVKLTFLTIDGYKSIYVNKNVEYLSLSDRNIIDLPSNIFDELTELCTISLSKNYLKKLPKGIFDKNTKLITIFLYHNLLSYLPRDIFKYNKNIRILHIMYNNILKYDIENIPNDLFCISLDIDLLIYDKFEILKCKNITTIKTTNFHLFSNDIEKMLNRYTTYKNALDYIPKQMFKILILKKLHTMKGEYFLDRAHCPTGFIPMNLMREDLNLT